MRTTLPEEALQRLAAADDGPMENSGRRCRWVDDAMQVSGLTERAGISATCGWIRCVVWLCLFIRYVCVCALGLSWQGRDLTEPRGV